MQDAHAALNAGLNLVSGVLLFAGWRAIRRRDVDLHRRLMLSALAVSALFLVSYLVRFALAGGTKTFGGTGWLRTLYLGVLLTHSVLAALVPFLALRVVWVAWPRACAGPPTPGWPAGPSRSGSTSR